MRFQGCRWLKAAPFISRSVDEDQYGTLHGSAGFGRSTALAWGMDHPCAIGRPGLCLSAHAATSATRPSSASGSVHLQQTKGRTPSQRPNRALHLGAQREGRAGPARAHEVRPCRLDESATLGRKRYGASSCAKASLAALVISGPPRLPACRKRLSQSMAFFLSSMALYVMPRL